MLTREEKQAIVTDLHDCFKKANAIFVTDLIGISANNAVSIRKQVRDAQGKVVITKNSLFERAAVGTNCEKMFLNLRGTNALAFAFNDAPAVAKVLDKASQELETVKIKAAFFEGKELSASEIQQIVNLPSRDQMLATLLATFNAPASAFVRVLDAICKAKEEK